MMRAMGCIDGQRSLCYFRERRVHVVTPCLDLFIGNDISKVLSIYVQRWMEKPNIIDSEYQ